MSSFGKFVDDNMIPAILVLMLLMIVFLVVGLPVISVKASQHTCAQYDGTSIIHQYDFWTGCRVQLPSGYWISASDAGSLEFFMNQGN